MKKFLKITAIVIVSLIVLLEVIPLAFRSKVNEVVKTEANKMLLAKVDFENLGISLDIETRSQSKSDLSCKFRVRLLVKSLLIKKLPFHVGRTEANGL